MISQVVSYSKHIGQQGAYGRGDNDMPVDSLAMAAPGQAPAVPDWIDYGPGEVASFYEGITCGLCDPEGTNPVEPQPNDQPCDALFREGKGKGRIKGQSKGKGQSQFKTSKGMLSSAGGGDAAAARPDPNEKRFCFHCHLQGRIEKNCHKKARVEPKAEGPTPRATNSLELPARQAGDYVAEVPMEGSVLSGIGSLERWCGALGRDDDFGLDP